MTQNFHPDKNISLDGDKAKSALWLSYAKREVDKLYDLSILNNNTNLTRKYYPNDETFIRIQVITGHKFIYIRSGDKCSEFISGISRHHRIYSERDQETLEDKNYMYEYQPAQRDLDDTTFQGWQKSEILKTEISSIYGVDPLFPLAQTGILKPSLYTGLMKKVVQIQLGMNKEIQWDFRYQKSHGIYINPINDDIYVIEISPRGVYSFKMNACSDNNRIDISLKKTPMSFKFPDGADFEKYIESGRIKLLIPSSQLIDFYSKTPFFEACGWAFNPKGTEAQNTVWDWPEDGYKRSYRYKISILFESATGIPMNGSFSLVDSGVMYMPARSSGFQVPLEFGSSQIVTFNMQKAQGSPDYNGAQQAPLYVYYEENGDECVCYKWNEGINDSYTEKLTEGYYSDWLVTANESYPLSTGNFGRKYERRVNGYIRSALFGYKTKYFTPQNEESDGIYQSKEMTPIETRGVSLSRTGGVQGYSYDSADSVKISEDNSNQYKGFISALIIPTNNRESHIYYQRKDKNTGVSRKYWLYICINNSKKIYNWILDPIDKEPPIDFYPATLYVSGTNDISSEYQDYILAPPFSTFASVTGESSPFSTKIISSNADYDRLTTTNRDQVVGYPISLSYAVSQGCNPFPWNQTPLSYNAVVKENDNTFEHIYNYYDCNGLSRNIIDYLPVYPLTPIDVWGGATGPTVLISIIKDSFSKNYYMNYNLNDFSTFSGHYDATYQLYTTTNGIPVGYTLGGMNFIGIPFPNSN